LTSTPLLQPPPYWYAPPPPPFPLPTNLSALICEIHHLTIIQGRFQVFRLLDTLCPPPRNIAFIRERTPPKEEDEKRPPPKQKCLMHSRLVDQDPFLLFLPFQSHLTINLPFALPYYLISLRGVRQRGDFFFCVIYWRP